MMPRDITPASVMGARSPILRPVTEVTSWLGGTYLGTVEVAGGTATVDASLIGGDLDLVVPRLPEWIPTAPDHPLSNLGQELLVRRGWAAADGSVAEWAAIGRFLIRRTVSEGDGLAVRAEGVGSRLEDDKFTDQFTVPGASMLTQAQRLLAGSQLSVRMAEGMTTRSARSRTWDRGQSRADALAELLTSWPAVGRIDPATRSVVIGPDPSTSGPVSATYADGSGGTVVEVGSGGGPQDGAPNACVASTAPEDGAVPFSAIAYVRTGPRRWGGPYGRRPAFFASPLLTTQAHVASASRTRLSSLQAEVWDLTVDMASCPAVMPDDLVRVRSDRDDTDVIGLVTSATVALTPGDEPGQIAVQAVRGRLGGVVI